MIFSVEKFIYYGSTKYKKADGKNLYLISNSQKYNCKVMVNMEGQVLTNIEQTVCCIVTS